MSVYRTIGPLVLVFVVVEKVDNSASLYSQSIQGHHICLLVKQVRLLWNVDMILEVNGLEAKSFIHVNCRGWRHISFS